MTHEEAIGTAAVLYGLTVVRYVLLAGGAYAFFWVWKQRRFAARRIQRRAPSAARIRSEILYSMSTALIIAGTATLVLCATLQGWTKVYFRLSDFGAPYFCFSIALALLIHDAYFYWTHRLLHRPKVFEHVHRVHHFSRTPSPWTAYSFHPLEALIQAAILPIIAFLLPIHYVALFIFITLNFGNNVLGHLGFELFPPGFARHRLFRWLSTSTHHDMHHQSFTCHYGLYFRWWDRLMETTHPDYTQRFKEITQAER